MPLNPFTLPHHESYWVLPGMLAAGEYPGNEDPSKARARVEHLLASGVTYVVDLTRPGELDPYEHILRELATRTGRDVGYGRFPIRDLQIPDDPALMRNVLDAIDRETERGGRVYVHCWGGVGRTGTAVGCYLVRRGLNGNQALERLARLFSAIPKSTRKAGSPETHAQREYVRTWDRQDGARRGPTQRARFRGALLGLACGDALGTSLEFQPPGSFSPVTDIIGGGPFGLDPGQWTDDTALALCSAASIAEVGRFDPADHMDRFVRWWRAGYMSCTGTCFDIGGTTRSALTRYEQSGDPFAGPTSPSTAGNGSLMRLAPVALWAAGAGCDQPSIARDASRITHGAPQAVDACVAFAAMLTAALEGHPKTRLLGSTTEELLGCAESAGIRSPIAEVVAGSYRVNEPPVVRGSGYVRDCLEAALWAFDRTADFREGALAAVNLGDDADTTGAVYGQLAGAFYGEEGIPVEWLEKLAWREIITNLADRLFALAR